MTKREQVYKCEVCGNMVEVVHVGIGQLVCCGQPMQLLSENSTDAAKEKHVPQVTTDGARIRVQVGSTHHPMTNDHYIEWVELTSGDAVERIYLAPGELPEASFNHGQTLSGVVVRAYCNLHGLWKSTLG